MGDILASVVVIVVVGIIIAVLFVVTGKKKKEREASIRQLAHDSGWQYEKVSQAQSSGFILRGEDWKLEALVNSTATPSEAGSSNVSFSNKWSTTTASSPGGMVLIGPKTPSIQLGGLDALFLQKALRLMIGEEADQAVGLAEVFVGRTAFRDRYSVWATNQASAEKLLSFELENALLNWKFKELPVLRATNIAIEITTMQERMDTPEKVQAMIDVGMALLGI